MPDQAYLIIRSSASASAFRDFCRGSESHAGKLVAAQPVHKITAFEPGSALFHTWIGRFSDRDSAKSAWKAMEKQMLAAPGEPSALIAGAVPAEGFDDDFIPTRANVDAGDDKQATLMIIEGSAEDQDAMDKYRNIILPMMKQLKAYYMVFEVGGSIDVLSGSWDEAIFAISRWPSLNAALRFWMDNTYQRTAIPLRLGHSAFQVVTFREENWMTGNNAFYGA